MGSEMEEIRIQASKFKNALAEIDKLTLSEAQELSKGGAFGHVLGWSLYHRPRAESVELFRRVMEIYRGDL